MRRVEQQVIEPSHPQFRAIDALAFASKNLWNLANYHVRQSFLFQQTYLNTSATNSASLVASVPRLRWEHAARGRPKAPRLRHVERHLRAAADLASAGRLF